MIALDASVVVKWFKEGEDSEEEALGILRKTKALEVACAASEWLILEVVRALVKADIRKAKSTMRTKL